MSGWQQDPYGRQQYPPQQTPPQWQQPGGQPYPQQQEYRPFPGQQPYPQQPQAPAPQPAPPANRKPSAARGCVTLLVLAGVIAIIIAVVTSGGGSGTTWKATVGNMVVINPGDVAVTVHVTNTGKSAATPTCTVNVSDPAGSYTGVDIGTLTSPVPAGQMVTYVDNVSVSNNGAAFVTEADASC